MTTQRVTGWTASTLLFDGDARQALAARFDDPEVRAALTAQTGPVGQRLIEQASGQIVQAAGSLLSTSLSDVLVKGWNLHQDLRAAAIETLEPFPAPPQKPVDLDPHEISVTQHPEVEVTLNGRRIVSLRFELAIVVTVSGLRAIVRVGRLAAVDSGSCTVTVTLSVQGARLARTVRELEAPLVVAFGEGIPLLVPRQAQRTSR